MCTRTRFFRPGGRLRRRARSARGSGRISWSCLRQRCAALDVGEKNVEACVRRPEPEGGTLQGDRRCAAFATTTNSLLALRASLIAEQITLVVIEATCEIVTVAAHSSCLRTA